MNDIDIGAQESLPQGSGQLFVHFYGGQVFYGFPEDVGGLPRSRADFEDIITQDTVAQSPGQNVTLDGLRPLRAGADPEMLLIHLTLVS
jgi:hypothetical protein